MADGLDDISRASYSIGKKFLTYKNNLTKEEHMEIVKLTSRCQLVLPAEVRKKLNVKAGDKIVFYEENGRIVIDNAAKLRIVHEEPIGTKEN